VDDGAAVEMPPQPAITKPVTTTESAANKIGTRTAQQTDRPTDMNAGDDIVEDIFENQTDSANPSGKEVILYFIFFTCEYKKNFKI
jgi:cytochrome oxidase Cu insertion factor (SCO1/SenC/PrrC family)